MSSYEDDRRYNQLLSAYNRLKANLESISDALEQKEAQWKRKDIYIDNLDKHARMLCEEILAKEKSEMRLGTEYSWSSVDTVDLLDKAFYSYQSYSKHRTDIMNKIATISEERATIIESLQDEIIHLKRNQRIGSMSESEIEEIAEQESKKSNNDNSYTKSTGIDYTTEEDCDFVKEDKQSMDTVESLNASYNDNKTVQLHSGRKFRESDTRNQHKNQSKREAIMTNTTHIDDVMSQIKETGWEILRLMGEYGMSERSKITRRILQEKNIDATESKINTTYRSLQGLGLIRSDTLRLPLQPSFCIHNLTTNGSKIYFAKFGKSATISEWDKIIAEHDNLEHGYGIKELLEVLKEKAVYKNLTMETRTKAIDVGNGNKCIPDIIGSYNKMPVYFEYERGTHTPSDFAVKLDKLIKASKIVNIVVPNTDVAENKIITKIDAYLKEKNVAALKNVVIRIATLKAINNPSLKLIDNADWQYIYDLNKGIGVKKNNFQ